MISTLKWKEALCEYIKVLPEMRRQTFLVSEETASFTLTQLKSLMGFVRPNISSETLTKVLFYSCFSKPDKVEH